MNRGTVAAITCFITFAALIFPGVYAKVKVKKLLAAAPPGSWVEQKEITKKFSAQELFDIINGGAVEYIDQGLLEGIHQQFTDKDGKIVEVFVEDFGTAEKAGTMLEAKKQGLSDIRQLTMPAGVKAFASKAIGALVVIASIGNFYIEMTVSGFSENSGAENAAAAFLENYQRRMK